ncbi:MAG: DNA-3-methyladenine glycosylase I [Balneolales bacterium]
MCKTRCSWCLAFDAYVTYHDNEWGVPSFEDKTQFEFLILESAQAGLSWATILKKREAYRIAYSEFDPVKVACYGDSEIKKLLNNPGIIRNKLKIEAAINNARRFIEVQELYGSFSDYIWDFMDGKPIINSWKRLEDVPSTSHISDKLAGDMKKKGFKFLGNKILYAHMQATGLVNDHLLDCYRYNEIKLMG